MSEFLARVGGTFLGVGIAWFVLIYPRLRELRRATRGGRSCRTRGH